MEFEVEIAEVIACEVSCRELCDFFMRFRWGWLACEFEQTDFNVRACDGLIACFEVGAR